MSRPKLELRGGALVKGPDWTAKKIKINNRSVICLDRGEGFDLVSLHELCELYGIHFSTIRDRVTRREAFSSIIRQAPKRSKPRERSARVKKNVELVTDALNERGFLLYRDLIELLGATKYDYVLRIMKLDGMMQSTTGARQIAVYHAPGNECWVELLPDDLFSLIFPDGFLGRQPKPKPKPKPKPRRLDFDSNSNPWGYFNSCFSLTGASESLL